MKKYITGIVLLFLILFISYRWWGVSSPKPEPVGQTVQENEPEGPSEQKKPKAFATENQRLSNEDFATRILERLETIKTNSQDQEAKIQAISKKVTDPAFAGTPDDRCTILVDILDLEKEAKSETSK